MGCNFGEGRTNFVSGHTVTFDFQIERIGTGTELDVILGPIANQETHRVQCQFEFRRNADETSTDELLYTIPPELDRQQMIIAVRIRLVAVARFNIPTII